MKMYSGGILWKRQGGGKAIEVDKADIMGVTWMKVPRTNQLGVWIKDGLYYKFTGFRDQDLATLTTFFQNTCGITPEEKQLSVSGRSWGEIDLNGNMLTFSVGSKQAFEKDSLMEISFHIPNSNTQFVGDENHPPAQVFRDKIMSMADVGPGGEDAVVTFDGIAILTPWHIESFSCEFAVFVQSYQPHTFVIISLDPPIRKGQTLYPHIVMQFETGFVVQSTLSLSEDLYNSKYKDKLEPSYKVTPFPFEFFSKFRSCQDGYAVKSSLKAEDGILYPLEKSFFFLPKPPTLILHEEFDYVEFERHAAGGSNMHYFDLLIRLKTEQEHLFRNIQRNEYHNLFDFISSKGLKIMNLGGVQTTDGVAAVLRDDVDDAVDPHLERIKNEAGGEESDEEDSDFVADKDDGGSPTDDSGEDDSDGSGSDHFQKPSKRESKKDPSSKRKSKDGDEDGKKKKDPNAPKRAMSGFMFFSQMERENVEKTNPGISFTEVGKVLGEKWKKMSAEEKEPHEAKARADKKRYRDEISGYKNPQPMNVDSGNESDSA
ncbi:hypothetical protein L6164_008418 [Bauhinia variegata]|uniref:Uncharacterized protein n=1 Tax=Bauhinia variegata TaxID=167791 RepID=A0ACB9PFU3_BAUVA|nr:hypothetical protein L6164_008418 [Bauhinia variegata]